MEFSLGIMCCMMYGNPAMIAALNAHQYDGSQIYKMCQVIAWPANMSHNFFLLEQIFGIVQTFLITTIICSPHSICNNLPNEWKSVWMLVEGFLCAENWISLQRKMNFPFSALDFIRWYCRQSSKLLSNKKRDGITFTTEAFCISPAYRMYWLETLTDLASDWH